MATSTFREVVPAILTSTSRIVVPPVDRYEMSSYVVLSREEPCRFATLNANLAFIVPGAAIIAQQETERYEFYTSVVPSSTSMASPQSTA